MGGSRGGDRGSGPPPPPPPPPPRIARLLVFAMLKFSLRPLLGIWTPPEKIFWIHACKVIKVFQLLQNRVWSLSFDVVVFITPAYIRVQYRSPYFHPSVHPSTIMSSKFGFPTPVIAVNSSVKPFIVIVNCMHLDLYFMVH